MKPWIGLFLIVVGILGGLYLGVWLCFIGGIVQVIEAVKADPVSSFGIAFGIVRVMAAGIVGWLFFFVCLGLGLATISSD